MTTEFSPLAQVARILTLMAYRPNRRTTPLPSDIPGKFDVWFDGGAVRMITGYNSYSFADGAKATKSTLTWLSVGITLPDGTTFSIQENRKKEAGK